MKLVHFLARVTTVTHAQLAGSDEKRKMCTTVFTQAEGRSSVWVRGAEEATDRRPLPFGQSGALS